MPTWLTHALTFWPDGAPVKLPCMSVKLSPPLLPKKLMISVPSGSVEPPALAFQKCPAPSSHAPTGGHSLQYGALPVPLHPPSRIIEELNKTLALTMQRFERWDPASCWKLWPLTLINVTKFCYPAALSVTVKVQAPKSCAEVFPFRSAMMSTQLRLGGRFLLNCKFFSYYFKIYFWFVFLYLTTFIFLI